MRLAILILIFFLYPGFLFGANYYPKPGAKFSHPEVKYDGPRIYWCIDNWPGIKFEFDKKVLLETCESAALEAFSHYDGAVKMNNCITEKYGDSEWKMYCDALNGFPMGKKVIMHAHSFEASSYKVCPQVMNPSHTVGWPNDKEPQRCYDPKDIVVGREPSSRYCQSEPNSFYLTDDDADTVKAAALDGQRNLNRMLSELQSGQSSESNVKLAEILGVNSVDNEIFSLVSSEILRSNTCLKAKLENISSDPSVENIQGMDSDSAGGVYCIDNLGDKLIQIDSGVLGNYNGLYNPFQLSDTIIHELIHSCGGNHPSRYHGMSYSDINEKLKFIVAGLPSSQVKKYVVKQVVSNPYFFELFLTAYR
ncbi:hypothetical protein [Shewanella algae]|uniref:hypothetical protein n=1 Tax=Shewanella algae TaxID=38313 RepID=UPI003004C528